MKEEINIDININTSQLRFLSSFQGTERLFIDEISWKTIDQS